MDNARLYQLSMAVVGSFFGITGLYNLLEGNIYTTTVLFTIAGVGIVLGAIYEASISPDPYVPGDRMALFIAGCAAVVLVTGMYNVVA